MNSQVAASLRILVSNCASVSFSCCLAWQNTYTSYVTFFLNKIHTFLYKKLIYKKLVLGRPNRKETFSTQATEVYINLHSFSFSYHNFEDEVTNFDKDMFKKESFCGTRCRYLFSTTKLCFLLPVVPF